MNMKDAINDLTVVGSLVSICYAPAIDAAISALKKTMVHDMATDPPKKGDFDKNGNAVFYVAEDNQWAVGNRFCNDKGWTRFAKRIPRWTHTPDWEG